MEVDDLTNGRVPVRGENRAPYVVTTAERRGVGVPREILDLTTTPVSLTFAAGIVQAKIKFSDLGSAVGDWIFVVFDALSDADAAVALADDQRRYRILLAEDVEPFGFDATAPCYRMDFASNVASETGDSVVRVWTKQVNA